MEVLQSEQFLKNFKNFPKEDRLKIACFIHHVMNHGLTRLEGRNKSSQEVPKDDPQWLQKVRYAQQHNLWHYHIGIPSYNDGCRYGDKTSEYVLHYIKGDGFVKIVDLSPHPPFTLPATNDLT